MVKLMNLNEQVNGEDSPKSQFLNFVAQTSDFPLGLEIISAEGIYLYTADSKKYIDFISGIAVSSLGHRHPKVIEAIQKQISKHLHVMVYGEFIQEPQSRLAGLLCSQLPECLQRVYFVNSGTEANEGALKLAKKFTGRQKLIGFRNSYHGDTHGSLSVTGREVYRNPFLPLLPQTEFLDFNSEKDFHRIDNTTAAVIVEPIQGEGGIIPAQRGWLESLRKQCDDAGALLIFDEIQSGFGRTGRLFAFQHYDVVPDILTAAKAMGGGMPIGAFISSNNIMSSLKTNPPLSHVTTFGGHPVSCAAAHANLKELLEGNYFARAEEIEHAVKNGIHGKGVVDIRGKGAMLGLQLRDKHLTQAVVQRCFEDGILLGWTLHADSLIRLAPPLVIDNDSLNYVLNQLNIHIEALAS